MMFRKLTFLTLLICSAGPLWAVPNELKPDECRKDATSQFYKVIELLKEYDAVPRDKVKPRREVNDKALVATQKLASIVNECKSPKLGELLGEAVKNYTHLTGELDALHLYKSYIESLESKSAQSATQTGIDTVYRLYWQLREFDFLRQWVETYQPSKLLKSNWALPIVSNLEISKAEFLVPTLGPDKSTNFDVNTLEANKLEVVVVADLFCGFSRKMFDDLFSGEAKFDHAMSITFVFGQFSNSEPRAIAKLASDIPRHKFAMVANEENWEMDIYFYRFPVFYFIYNDAVVDKVLGWPNENQSEVINRKWHTIRKQKGVNL